MKKIKFVLVALMAVFGFNNAMAAELVNSTQYDTNGFQYVIKTMTKTGDALNAWTGTVSMKQNTFNGTSITINPTVDITVEGTVATAGGATCKGTITFKIVEIEENGFAGLENVNSVIFASGCNIEKIGAGAFAGTKIVNLDLTNTKIEELNKLFENGNTALKTVVLPASLKKVNDYALEHCFALGSIDASKCTKLQVLGKSCFGDNAVTELNLKATIVESLENNPFVGSTPVVQNGPISGAMNKTLKKLYLPVVVVDGVETPGSVEEIATGLANLYNLEEVNLQMTKIQDVPAGAFENDKSLTSLEFPKTLKTIRNANMFKGCQSLATLRICYDVLQQVGYGENYFFVNADNETNTVAALKTLEFFTTSPATYDFRANVTGKAFRNCTGITSVKIAVGDDIAYVEDRALTAGAIALSNEEASTVQMGNLKNNVPQAGFIVGPTATNVAANVTIGDVAAAQNQTSGIVSGNIGTFTVGKISATLPVEAIGLAQTIVFSGDITTALTVAEPRVPNTRLTTINFGSIKIADVANIIPRGAFDQNNAPLLTAVTWTPTIVAEGANAYKPQNLIFNKFAFGAEGDPFGRQDAASKITFTTVPEIAGLYRGNVSDPSILDPDLYNVVFAFVLPDVFEAIKVYGPADAAVYVGYFVCPLDANAAQPKNYYIEKKQGDAVITVYSAFVDASDNKIYMDPLMIVDGKFIVKAGQVVVVRSTTGDDVKAYACDDLETMRYYGLDEDGNPVLVNELQYTATAISADQLGTQYYDHGQYVYYMKNPATATGINFAELGPTQYLFAKAVYIVKAGGASAGRLEVVWLDGANDATAIQAIQNKVSASNDAIYNLAGQKVSASYKGVVIKNGKKYIQK